MRSYGAITVVNAIPCGMGAAVGIDLVTDAVFNDRGHGRNVNIVNDPGEDTEMARICVKNTFDYFLIDEPEDWSLSVDSQIPVSKGLKSSSSACNAIISAVAEWISKRYDCEVFDGGPLEMIHLGIMCAREANVTVTGAFDDACACHLGGFVITDNHNDILLRRVRTEENDVILLIPEAKIRKPHLNRGAFCVLSDKMRKIVMNAEKDWYSALTENGRLIANVIGIDDSIAKRALKAGALAAGVSGTGPAVSVVVGKGEGRSFLNDLDHDGYGAIVAGTR